MAKTILTGVLGASQHFVVLPGNRLSPPTLAQDRSRVKTLFGFPADLEVRTNT
jgi:hypothetical protein